MHPELLNITSEFSIKTYGFCLAVGFAAAAWAAMRRVIRFGQDPDVLLKISFLSVVGGVVGARILFVIHYWETFASRRNPLLAALDIRQGGLEFLGGFLCATVLVTTYLIWEKRKARNLPKSKRFSILLYLDLATPSVMIGLAITRLGCFGNGCCFGDVCIDQETGKSQYVWAVQFPFNSPAYKKQWKDRHLAVPAELIVTASGLVKPRLVDRLALANLNRKSSARLLARQCQYPSRADPTRKYLPVELQSLASSMRSRYVHPTQLYATINALLVCGVLSGLLYVRRREGMVFLSLFLVYPPGHFILEAIRTDNPHDSFGLTISQFAGVVMFAFGLLAMIALYLLVPPNAQREHFPSLRAAPVSQKSQRSSKKRKRRKKVNI